MLHKCLPISALAVVGAVATLLLSIAPTVANAQPSGGNAVSFTTQDASGNNLALAGHLWVPPGAAKGVVVLVHGSGGWSDHREGHYGRALSIAGYAALALDAFGPRGISETATNQTQISPMQMTRDAFSARRFLIERGFPADRMAVMGFSRGGSVALYAADRNFLPEQVDRFAVAIAFYPGCTIRPRAPKPVSAVFIALGEKDDYTGIKPCQEVADDFGKAGGKIAVKTYPGAAHGFDGNPANTAMTYSRFADNFMDCRVYLEEDGQYALAGKRHANDSTIVEAMRTSCGRKGASFWTNTRQKEAATRDLIDFLNNAFAK